VLVIFVLPTNPKVVAFEVITALATSGAILTISYLLYYNCNSDYITRPYRSTIVDL
jgi:hypothetical protein